MILDGTLVRIAVVLVHSGRVRRLASDPVVNVHVIDAASLLVWARAARFDTPSDLRSNPLAQSML